MYHIYIYVYIHMAIYTIYAMYEYLNSQHVAITVYQILFQVLYLVLFIVYYYSLRLITSVR